VKGLFAPRPQEVVDAFFADAEKEFGDESLRVKKLQKQFEGRQKMATSAAEGLNNWWTQLLNEAIW
jgi:hypothetical protein